MVDTVASYWGRMSEAKARAFLRRNDSDLAKTSTVVIAKYLAEKSLHSVLDIGCGPGIDALHYAQVLGDSIEYTGIDATESFVVIAQERLVQYKTYSVQRCDLFSVSDAGYTDNKYDAVICKNVLEHCMPPHIDSCFNYITALRCVLSVPSRFVFLGFFNGLGNNKTITLDRKNVVYTAFGRDDFCSLLEVCGISQYECVDVPGGTQSLIICDRKDKGI